MVHSIIPVFNGYFTVLFEGETQIHAPKVENIPSFFFVIKSDNGDIAVVDTGFSRDYIPGVGSYCDRTLEQEAGSMMLSRGFDPLKVRNVIMTHMHWDHTGAMKIFKNAEFIIQRYEFLQMMNLNPNEETYYNPAHWMDLLPRVHVVNGNMEFSPGISLIQTGGHTHGHQAVKVTTRDGSVMLVGDSPFNYDMLWKMFPEEYWDKFKNGPGKRFYWDNKTISALKNYVYQLGAPIQYTPRTMAYADLRRLADTVVFSHDPKLVSVDSIPSRC